MRRMFFGVTMHPALILVLCTVGAPIALLLLAVRIVRHPTLGLKLLAIPVAAFASAFTYGLVCAAIH